VDDVKSKYDIYDILTGHAHNKDGKRKAKTFPREGFLNVAVAWRAFCARLGWYFDEQAMGF
jgi:hypothetical protein